MTYVVLSARPMEDRLYMTTGGKSVTDPAFARHFPTSESAERFADALSLVNDRQYRVARLDDTLCLQEIL